MKLKWEVFIFDQCSKIGKCLFFSKTGLGPEQSLGEMESQFVSGVDPKLAYLEQVAQDNSEKLKITQAERNAANEAALKNEKTAKELQIRNEQLVFSQFPRQYQN